jgi:lysophospholipase L1-like esterase
MTRPFRRVGAAVVGMLLAGFAVGTMGAARAAPDFASVKPTPRVEHWQRRLADIDAALRDRAGLAAVKLVFVGDSITDFWLFDDNPWGQGKYGREVWDGAFGGAVPANRALNLGISGDRSEHVLHRLLPRAAGGLGELDAPELNSEFFIVLIGINNSWAAEAPVADSIFEGVRAVLTALHERKPRARIVLQSLLPANEPARNAEVVQPVNRRLAFLAASPEWAGFTSWLDLHAAFVDASGRQIARYFTDGLHPSDAAYAVWRDRLLPFLALQRGAAPARQPVRGPALCSSWARGVPKE